MNDQKDIVRLIAEILSGIQVPLSLGVLGVAVEPLGKLRDRLCLRGWPDADEHEEKLQEYIKEKLKSE